MKANVKMISLALSALMLTVSISGCGDKVNENGGTTVTIWSGDSHSKEVVTDFYKNWNEKESKKRGITVDYIVHGGDSISSVVELALQNGTAPDFFPTGDLVKLAENGDILAIEDIPGGEEFLKPYKEAGILREGRAQYKGKTYRIPVSACPQGLIYNKDMFKEAGIVDENGEAKPPKTWKEVREYAKKLTNKSKNQFGIIAPLKWSNWFSSDISGPAMSLCGFMGYNPATGEFDYSAYKAPMEAWIGMKEDGSIYPGADSLDNDSARALFSEGNVGMKFAFYFDVGVLNDQFPAKCDWGVAPYPVNEDGTAYKQRMDYGYSPYINKKSAVLPEKLLEVLKIQVSDEYVKEMYKECIAMPINSEIVEGIDLTNQKDGWKEFAQLEKVSSLSPRQPKSDMAGLEDVGTIFTKYIFAGKMSVDDGIKLAEENIKKGVEAYYAIHDEESVNDFIIKDWQPIIQ